MKAIETSYKGYRFRSRLEARWAIYFDTLGVEWEYEPEGFILDDGTMYLPDFYIKDWDCYAEVKPAQFTEQEYNKCRGLDRPCVLLDTSTPLVKHGYYACYNTGEPEYYKTYTDHKEWHDVLLEWSAAKHRLWFLLGERIEDYGLDMAPEIAAKSARFEHGETPGG